MENDQPLDGFRFTESVSSLSISKKYNLSMNDSIGRGSNIQATNITKNAIHS